MEAASAAIQSLMSALKSRTKPLPQNKIINDRYRPLVYSKAYMWVCIRHLFCVQECLENIMLLVIEGAGKVSVERCMRAGRMRITVRPGLIRVSVPRGIPLESGRAFAVAQMAWISRQLLRIQARTRIHEELTAGLPQISDRAEASSVIISRCRELSAKTGLVFSRITIREQKTIWGSCSSGNTISLNINLARLPDRLRDYVILHELVHTKIRGHGRAFWDELDRYIPNARALRRELKRYLLRLMVSCPG